MSYRHCIATALFLSLPTYAAYAADPPKPSNAAPKASSAEPKAEAPKINEDAPIIEDGHVKVDEGDVLAFLMRVPEDKRATFRTSYDRIAGVADGLFLARTLANRSRSEGLDKDPIVQRRLKQAEDAVLADVYAEKVRDKQKDVNLDARARELYLADPEQFRTPETLSIEHILVNLNGRTREQARERAQDLYQRAKGGEDFMMLAGRYSDDPLKTRNGGRYDAAPIESYDPRWRTAINQLKKGELSAPIESDDGFHIFRLVERKPPQVPKFEEVKEKIVAAERERLAKERQEELIRDIRASSTVVTHRDSLEALVIPIDEEKLRQAQEAAEKAITQSKAAGAASAAKPAASGSKVQ